MSNSFSESDSRIDAAKALQELNFELGLRPTEKETVEFLDLCRQYDETVADLAQVGYDRTHANINIEQHFREVADRYNKTGQTAEALSKKDLREKLKAKGSTLKANLRRISWRVTEIVRPLRAEFVRLALPHIDAIEAAEREHWADYGIPHSPSGFVTGLRSALALIERPLADSPGETPLYLNPAGLLNFVKDLG